MSKIGCHRFVVMASARLGNQILEINPKRVRVIPIMFKGGSHRKQHPAKQPKDSKKKTDPSSVNLSAIDLWSWTCQAGKPHPGKQLKNNKEDPSSVNLEAIALWSWPCQAGKPHPGKNT